MDIFTWLGLVAGFGIIIAAIVSGSSIFDFVNLPGILIVFVGTFVVTLMKFRLQSMATSMKLAFSTVFLDRVERPIEIYEQVRELAEVVRREGLLGLERVEISNPFLQKAVNLGIDGHPPEFVEEILIEDTQQTLERLTVAEKLFRGIGEAAPGLGMLGTLVGLVQMLNNMSSPDTIGPAMAVALLTTFYGSAIAQLFALPLADKLELKAGEEQRNRMIVIQSFLSILRGQNPRMLPDIIASYLPELLDANGRPVQSAAPGKGSG